MPKSLLIGLAGERGAGKDSAAEALLPLGFRRVSFADPLKDICAEVWGVPRVVFDDPADKDQWFPPRELLRAQADALLAAYERRAGVVVEEAAEERLRFRADLVVYHSWRSLLQRVGTDLFRACVADDCWLRLFEPTGNCVCCDVRFPGERQAIRRYGGVLVRLKPQWPLPTGEHISETQLGEDGEYDAVIPSRRGEVAQLRGDLLRAVARVVAARAGSTAK